MIRSPSDTVFTRLRALLAIALSAAALALDLTVAAAQQQPSGGTPAEIAPEDIPMAPKAKSGPAGPTVETAPSQPAPAPAPTPLPSPAPVAPAPRPTPSPSPASASPSTASPTDKPAKPGKQEARRATEARIGYDGQANDPSKPVHVRIVSPRQGEVLPANNGGGSANAGGSADGGPASPATATASATKVINTVEVLFEVENYTMADYGNRLHVIVDNEPPVAWHDITKPLILKNLAEGGHLIRAMAVKPDGRALSNAQAFSMTSFYIGRKNFLNFVVPNNPLLTVNLPVNGVQDVDDTSTIWLDFVTHNAPIGKGYMLRYRINSQEEFVTDDKPSFWTGLKPGRYEFMAELVDTAKRPVPGIFNRVTRVFDLRAMHKAMPITPEPASGGTSTTPTPAPKKKPPSEPMD